MEQSKIDRINELARKAKSGQPLTAEEMAEREELRAEYLQAVRTHMANVLEHTVIQYPDGRREKVRAKTAPVAAQENPEDQMVRAALAPGGEPLCLVSDSVEATERQGAALARLFEASVGTDDPLPPFVALYGDLGAGKTAFVRGFASILAPGAAVHSPTFALVNEYRAPEHPPLFHFDMYRIGSEDELYSMGYEDYLDRGICLCEWSENIPDALPAERVEVRIGKDAAHPDRRTLSVCVKGDPIC